MFRYCALLSFFFFAVVNSGPVGELQTPEDKFFRSLEDNERKALMQMALENVVDVRGIESQGSEITLTIPEALRQRVNSKTDPEFQRKLVAWIGQEWNLSDRAVIDLQLTGRGCRDDGTCITIYDLDHTCCPFG